ncbi:hypothetical protein CDAR_251931 [Caerostris darwini]|uniref:Uncharacterized protein n=1 Tax=Caerostris darwini TaxID=1538125 RepID=A0AAV4V5V4_9ARAC|nr:hypothetical protein CDAR_251931 [Caerostris darwini]
MKAKKTFFSQNSVIKLYGKEELKIEFSSSLKQQQKSCFNCCCSKKRVFFSNQPLWGLQLQKAPRERSYSVIVTSEHEMVVVVTKTLGKGRPLREEDKQKEKSKCFERNLIVWDSWQAEGRWRIQRSYRKP